ncbi:MAG: hypothetical protein M1814_002850 [Vezdaea aestivalis]|nr:MAG: hypothetical protein M1814_002850 [Vezdaea aestivalis]
MQASMSPRSSLLPDHGGLHTSTGTTQSYSQPDHSTGADYQGSGFQFPVATGGYVGSEVPNFDGLHNGFSNFNIGPGVYGQPPRPEIVMNSMPSHIGNETLLPLPIPDGEGFILLDSNNNTRGQFLNNQFFPYTSPRFAQYPGYDQAAIASQYSGSHGGQRYGLVTPVYPPAAGARGWESPLLPVKEVPGLENRRTSAGSWVSDTRRPSPRTPSFGGQYAPPNLALIPAEHLPLAYASSTPSPLSTASFGPLKALDSRFLPANLSAILKQDPAIPEPTLAMGPKQLRMDDALFNPLAHSNVYIKGLSPDTTDEILEVWAKRFGDVHQTKAIIDTISKKCKGYGFARFITIADAQYCVMAFRHGGYEASFAKESFNALLKQNADESSTNLYLSGLPLQLTSETLASFFAGYELASARVLVDDATGKSRGVGFARFLSRASCEEVIKKFHGQPYGEENNVLQVRYADTPEQKALKYEAASRRQLRAPSEPISLRDRAHYLRTTPESESFIRPRLSPHYNSPRGFAPLPVGTRSFERVRALRPASSFDHAPREAEQSPSVRKATSVGNSTQELEDITETNGTCPTPAIKVKSDPASPSLENSADDVGE